MMSAGAWAVAVAVLAADPTPTPTVAVLLARRTGVTADDARRVAESTVAEVKARGLSVIPFEDGQKRLKSAGVSDTLACGGRPPCLTAAAARLGATHVVLLSGLQVEADRAWVLEALDVASGAPLAKHDWTDTAAAPSSAAVQDFTARLAGALAPAPAAPPPPQAAPPPKDAPTAATLTPAPTAPPPTLVEPAPPAPAPKVAPKVLLVVAGVLAAAAAGALVGGVVTDAKLAQKDAAGVSPLTYGQALQTRDTANALLWTALGAGVLAAGAGTAAALTW